MTKLSAALITLAVGLFFFLGIFIVKKIKNSQSIYKFSTALALSVIGGLLLFDIIPEIIECFKPLALTKKIIYILAYSLIGIIVLKLLDTLIPVHNHEHKEHEHNLKEHNDHLFHIGLITSLALIIHNIIEGMAIYSIALSSLKAGILMGLGVAFHNIPMSIEIGLTFQMAKKSKFKQIITYLFLALSTFLGGCIMILFNKVNIIIIGVFMCITMGMLIYISLFELWGEVRRNIFQKETIGGLISGIVLMLITLIM